MSETQEAAPSLPQSVFLRIAFDALALRAARWVSLFMAFVLFGAAVYYPDWRRIVAAAGFTILAHLPLWMKKERQSG